MNVTFKDIYLPVKANLYGPILAHTMKEKDELITEVKVLFDNDGIKPPLTLSIYHKGQCKAFWYGKTQKEIRILERDVNEFYNDPHLFLNQ